MWWWEWDGCVFHQWPGGHQRRPWRTKRVPENLGGPDDDNAIGSPTTLIWHSTWNNQYSLWQSSCCRVSYYRVDYKTRRADKNPRTQDAGSFQILSPVVLHRKPAVKRKETRRSCLRHPSSSTTSLRAQGLSEYTPECYSPMASSPKKKKVVRFCEEVRWMKVHS